MPNTRAHTTIRVLPCTDGEHGCILLGEGDYVLRDREQLLEIASRIYEVVNEIDKQMAQWFYARPGPLSLLPARHLMRKGACDPKGHAACGATPLKLTGDEWIFIAIVGEPSREICPQCLAIYDKEQQNSEPGYSHNGKLAGGYQKPNRSRARS